jgi:hypothetical protein
MAGGLTLTSNRVMEGNPEKVISVLNPSRSLYPLMIFLAVGEGAAMFLPPEEP